MSSITLVAAPNGLTSPYLLRNKHTCEEWESFIKGHQGKLQGKCSAWALIIQGEITDKANWSFKIKKSTTSASSIFISSKKSIIDFSTIQASNIDLQNASFLIRRKNLFDFIRLKLSSNYKRLNNKLILKTYDIDPTGNHWLVLLIKQLPTSANVDIIKYNHKEKTLMLQFKSILDDFDFVNRLIHD